MSHHSDILNHPPSVLPASYFEHENWARVHIDVRGRKYTARVLEGHTDGRHDVCFLVYRENDDGSAQLYRHVMAKPITPHGRGIYEDPPSEIPRSEIESYGFFHFRSDGSTHDYFVGEQKRRGRHHIALMYKDRLKNPNVFSRIHHYHIRDISV